MNIVVDAKAIGGITSSVQGNSYVNVKWMQVVRGGTCFICGREGHLARDRSAPLEVKIVSCGGRKFDQCGEIGHFKV